MQKLCQLSPSWLNLLLKFLCTFETMKIFSLLLMLLILAMNFKPCADEIFIDTSEVVHTVIEKTADHQSTGADDCSPFCYCACCSVRSFSAKETVVTIFLPQIKIQEPNFLLGHVHQISLSIWQPPQLV